MKTVFNLPTVRLQPGVTLIEASAGTGKTFCLAGLILRLVLEKHLAINEILGVTYTVAATAELKARVRLRLREALDQLRLRRTDDEILRRVLDRGNVEQSLHELDLALQSFDEAQVFTIHSFCQQVLHDYAFESGIAFDSELVTDPSPLFEEVARDFWRVTFHTTRPLIGALMLAWEKSPSEWVNLLERTGNHPELVFLPPEGPKSFPQLVRKIEKTMEAICKEWRLSNRAVERILRKDRNLARHQNAFRSDRVDMLLQQVQEACGDFKSADPTCLKVFRDLTSEAVHEATLANHTPPSHHFFDLCQTFSAAVQELFLRLIHDFLRYAKGELSKRKSRTNIVTFDDLVLFLRSALRSAGGAKLAHAIGGKYRAALIDEFQDTDPAQYEIFQRIFGTGKHHLYYIGDPKQAIYGFRGADVFTYLRASAKAKRNFTLGTNWRSEQSLVEAVNELFRQTSNPFVLPNIEFHEIKATTEPEFPLLTKLPKTSKAPLDFRIVPSTRANGRPMNQQEATIAVCQAVAADIARLRSGGAQLGGRPVGFGDVAILVRQNRQADQMQEILREHGIRSIVQSGRSVFDSTEAKELQQLLQGIIEPGADRLFKAALITNLIGLNADALTALENDETARQQWLDKFSDWRNRWISDCFIAVFRQILAGENVRARLVQLPAGERRLTNFLHLTELLHMAETSQLLSPDGLCSWLRKQRNRNRVSQDEFQLRLESDIDAVQIVTIHKAKGLEYPVVFCPFLWTAAESLARDELQFHDRKNHDRLTLSLRGKDTDTSEQRRWQTEEITSEEVRMMYVGVTRAKNRCTIHLPDYQSIEKSTIACLFGEAIRFDLPKALAKLAKTSSDRISVSSVRKDSNRVVVRAAKSVTLSARPFNGSIDRTAMVASFSGLSTGRIELEEREPEVSDRPDAVVDGMVTPGDTIFDFPRGARAGDFFHAILERLDFIAPNFEQLVDEQLVWHGFAKTKCRGAILANLRGLLDVELAPGMSLKNVEKNSRRSELEFTYRLNRLSPRRLREIFRRCSELPGGFTDSLGRLRFDPVEGYLRGFIDLLFEFGGRYFILDWKSNWLGNRPSDYDEQGMRDSMLAHNYYLQSHLYVLAADLFLRTRLKDYRYERDFGGVFYLFLRGLDPKEPARGVFRQTPTVETITALRELAA